MDGRAVRNWKCVRNDVVRAGCRYFCHAGRSDSTNEGKNDQMIRMNARRSNGYYRSQIVRCVARRLDGLHRLALMRVALEAGLAVLEEERLAMASESDVRWCEHHVTDLG